MKKRPAVMNGVWFFLVLVSVTVAAYTGKMQEVVDASFESAKSAVTLAIGLVGAMALWLGLMKVAEKGGLLLLVARVIRPAMVRLFPRIPPEHPAMSAMVMNISANALGLGNAATPMGLKAMMELDRLNPVKGRATDAMCMFLAVNTSNVTLLPLGVMAVRASAGSAQPAAIIVPTPACHPLFHRCRCYSGPFSGQDLEGSGPGPGGPRDRHAGRNKGLCRGESGNKLPGRRNHGSFRTRAPGTMGLLGISGSLSGGSSASVRASGFHVGSGEGSALLLAAAYELWVGCWCSAICAAWEFTKRPPKAPKKDSRWLFGSFPFW